MPIVIDANVLISCLIRPDGRTGRVREFLQERRFVILYSRETLAEFNAVISRPRLVEKYRVQDQDIHAFRSLILLRGKKIKTKTRVRICRDPKDNAYLALALDGKADFIVSGDDDLLSLSPFHGTPVITPARFLVMLEK